ncbi:MAG: hypothetical protein WDO71_08530 [Bacteroidota bacterium]
MLFQLPGGGYAALNIAGDIRGHEPLFDRQNRNRLGIAVLVFAFGEILHLSYRQHLHLGKKYHIKYIPLKIYEKKSF